MLLANIWNRRAEKIANLKHLPPRGGDGLLRNWPINVVALINGVPVTTEDMLNTKRARQARRLTRIRQPYDSRQVPCFVWVFYNPHWIYMGWHLYVRTVRQAWCLTLYNNKPLAREIMALFPCGYLPMPELFRDWKKAFAAAYPRSTARRSSGQRHGCSTSHRELHGRASDRNKAVVGHKYRLGYTWVHTQTKNKRGIA